MAFLIKFCKKGEAVKFLQPLLMSLASYVPVTQHVAQGKVPAIVFTIAQAGAGIGMALVLFVYQNILKKDKNLEYLYPVFFGLAAMAILMYGLISSTQFMFYVGLIYFIVTVILFVFLLYRHKRNR